MYELSMVKRGWHSYDPHPGPKVGCVRQSVLQSVIVDVIDMIVEISLISNKVVPEGFLPAEVWEVAVRGLNNLEALTDRFQAIKVVLVRVKGQMGMELLCDLKITS
jgi:hypothetical protein